ncbi:hypothetical protein HELRODRAFT_183432 [Helobdella robusta]|uniref:Endonuclease/exonuclease/phosphatase domain-containing protein n=1 Tax=Helobdella robusta TaxID=6412 RepID=T1FJN0_HELRO|nr:hypothetical protein HELRODRAFT_183432 [Helobdella robusta]ESO11191.1 hypothetical protein HELRODRAFT_183432 [Helobdella robusta]
MASKRLQISELLWFFCENLNIIENEKFKNAVVEFYNSEEISTAKKLLLNELDIIKKDKKEKLSLKQGGNKKVDKVVELVEIFKYITSNDLQQNLPTFVILNPSRVPREGLDILDIIQINNDKMVEKLNELTEMNKSLLSMHNVRLSNEQVSVRDRINKYSLDSTNLINKYLVSNLHEPELEIAKINSVNNNNIPWSDAVQTPSDMLQTYAMVVNRNKNRTKLSTSSVEKNINVVNTVKNPPNENINKMEQSKKPAKRIIGTKIIEHVKLQPDKIIMKKKVFCLSNVKKCHRDDVVEFLQTSGINVITCFPVIKRTDETDPKAINNDEHSTMFRVCVEKKDEVNEDSIGINGFNFVGKNRSGRHGGGVGLFVKDDIIFKIRNDLMISNELELFAIEVGISSKNNSLIIVTYRPPHCSKKVYMKQLEQVLLAINNEKKLVYLTGDLNIDLLENYESYSSQLQNLLTSYNLKALINKPTKINIQKNSLIDNIFTNASENVTVCGVHLTDISDNLPIFACFKQQLVKIEFENRENQFSFSRHKIDKLNERLLSTDWTDVLLCSDVDAAFELFTNIFRVAFKDCCQISSLGKIKKILKQKPWVTTDFRRMLNKKKYLYKKFIKNSSSENFLKFKSQSQICNKFIRGFKNVYYKVRLYGVRRKNPIRDMA